MSGFTLIGKCLHPVNFISINFQYELCSIMHALADTYLHLYLKDLGVPKKRAPRIVMECITKLDLEFV